MSDNSNNNIGGDGGNDDGEGHFGGPVGKGNPPRSGQFKKGQSGNPKGPPKKKKNSFKEDVADILNSEAEVRGGGKEVVSKIILKNLIAKATKGEPTALKYVFPLLKMTDDSPEMELLPEDEKILKDIADSLGYIKEDEDGS